MDKRYVENGLMGLVGEVARIDTQLSDIEMLEIRKEKLLTKRISLIKKINMVEAYREDQISDKATYEEKMFQEVEKCGIDSMYTRIPWFNKTIEALGRQLADLKNQLDDLTGLINSIDSQLSHKERLNAKRAIVIEEIKNIKKQMDDTMHRANTQDQDEPTA